MGDIADAMINGLFCASCGVILDGDEPGFPRYCSKSCRGQECGPVVADEFDPTAHGWTTSEEGR